MKRIAIFCDGTWNRSDGGHSTSVVQLAQAVSPSAADGITQQVFYLQGVGTGRGSNRFARATDKWLGGALGWGLDDNIHEAFRNLVFCFEPGDEIFIFGFSRGAYTARSLGGLIRSVGIPSRRHVADIPQAMAMYRARGKESHPDSPASMAFRAALSPDTATSTEELAWRKAAGHPPAKLLTIAYLGLWDTVGALGLPGFLGAVPKVLNRRYQFHDTDLSRSVRSARHALALDERRRLYPPTLWDNLDDLNGEATGDERPYQQKWFAGNHSVVGGSGPVPGLSALACNWIAEGAREHLLEFDREMLQAVVPVPDPLADMTEAVQQAGIANLGGRLLRDRDGPDTEAEIAPPARQRIENRADYRPGSLRRAMSTFFQ